MSEHTHVEERRGLPPAILPAATQASAHGVATPALWRAARVACWPIGAPRVPRRRYRGNHLRVSLRAGRCERE
eukprot:9496729-Pyramimonas_sp.AAC.1